jgi:hypothetical protein
MIRIRLFLALLIAIGVYRHFEPSTRPNPNPVDPTPGPGVEKVLIEYETAPSPDYTTEQKTALQNARSGDVQAWTKLNTAESHVLDKDADVSALDKFWKDAVEAAKVKPLPNISVYNGRRWTVRQKPIANTADVKASIGMKP